MFKPGHYVQTPHGKAVILRKLGNTNMSVQLDATFEVLTVKSEYIMPMPISLPGKGTWLPAQAGTLTLGQTVMTIDGQVATVTKLWGKTWADITAKPKCQQIYALRVFVPEGAEYVAIAPEERNFARFAAVKQDEKWTNYWKLWVSKFQATHQKAVTNYCNSWYRPVNEHLRAGFPAHTMKYIDRLDAALYMVTTYADMLVWRKGSSKFDITMPVGSTFSDLGFGSCSIRKSFADDWSGTSGGKGVLFEIRVPKGSYGGYTGDYSPHTEYEFLLPRGATYRIVKITKRPSKPPIVVVDLIKQEVYA